MNIPNQNNELDEISNINENTLGLIKENNLNFNLSYISQSENNTFHLESNNASFYLNLPIFRTQEKQKNNNTIENEKSPTEEKELYLIENPNNLRISPPKPFTILNKKRRGRKKPEIKQNEINEKYNDYIKIHDKYVIDNLLRKIQVHYLNFILVFFK